MSPIQPTDNFPRVHRGGSWSVASASGVRAAFRYGYTPTLRNDYFGFRCAQRGSRQPLGKVTP